jgi:hypothetical protein
MIRFLSNKVGQAAGAELWSTFVWAGITSSSLSLSVKTGVNCLRTPRKAR